MSRSNQLIRIEPDEELEFQVIEVTNVVVVEPYVLKVTFNDGTVRWIDVASVLWGPMFEPLRDPQLFAAVRVDAELGTVVWPNGADLAPEYLYEHGEIHQPYART